MNHFFGFSKILLFLFYSFSMFEWKLSVQVRTYIYKLNKLNIYIFWIYLYRNLYSVELTNHIELLKHLVIYIRKTYVCLSLIHRFTLIGSLCNKVSVSIIYTYLRGHVVSFV